MLQILSSHTAAPWPHWLLAFARVESFESTLFSKVHNPQVRLHETFFHEADGERLFCLVCEALAVSWFGSAPRRISMRQQPLAFDARLWECPCMTC